MTPKLNFVKRCLPRTDRTLGNGFTDPDSIFLSASRVSLGDDKTSFSVRSISTVTSCNPMCPIILEEIEPEAHVGKRTEKQAFTWFKLIRQHSLINTKKHGKMTSSTSCPELPVYKCSFSFPLRKANKWHLFMVLK